MTFKMKGMSFKEGQSPIRSTKEESFKASEPSSSKEELMKIAEQFTRPIRNLDLDYGGYFDTNFDINATGGEEEEETEVMKMPRLGVKKLPVELGGPDLKKRKPYKPKKKKEKTPGSFITLEDIKKSNKKAAKKGEFHKDIQSGKSEVKVSKITS